MAVKFDRHPIRTAGEYLTNRPIEYILRNKLSDRMISLFIARVDGNERLGPKALLFACSINLSTDFRCADLRKGARERFVSLYQRLIERRALGFLEMLPAWSRVRVAESQQTEVASAAMWILEPVHHQHCAFQKEAVRMR